MYRVNKASAAKHFTAVNLFYPDLEPYPASLRRRFTLHSLLAVASTKQTRVCRSFPTTSTWITLHTRDKAAWT
ncbi:hypothetical protein N7468_007558 [Penicillium chermesinum]|uniref:Uncharacterized protein n=1 Tax=Penicillium chermesinum TaxID=63820 RepID=A0A9W9NUN6_9EURO|nr:uncharacterized protein N7468_007558 [Penicillium chermesinum]KAJ5226333.1 hypothetical protein N7468_007558 [Penicillium chermesinum]KAJ6160481.1 hypothetical protein N7470_003877 [Penicillium chermesinum]